MSSTHFIALRVARILPEADDAVTVELAPPAEHAAAFRFTPGQHLTLRHRFDEREERRSYSLCSLPGEPMRIGVRRVPGGRFSTWIHETLRAGDLIEALPPDGRFGAVLEAVLGDPAAPAPRHVLAVAGGSGITPILSIIGTLLAHSPQTRCTLIYGNRTLASTMFKEALEDLKNAHMQRLSLQTLFSREEMDSPASSGHIDQERIRELLASRLDPHGIDHAFICGPHAMNDAVEQALVAGGVPASRVHVERFGAPPAQPLDARERSASRVAAGTARVRVVRDGLARELLLPFDGESLLDAAAAAGMDVPYSCKSGVCATCRAKVLEGEMRMARNFALAPDDLAAGFVLTCQAHPVSERVSISFDAR
jgi:ring-1,2-phenylacetyl-CoA epoxidase subunit PaaE